nr:MAG TPA: hypothetical protein [Caudoviricetes sp.]
MPLPYPWYTYILSYICIIVNDFIVFYSIIYVYQNYYINVNIIVWKYTI